MNTSSAQGTDAFDLSQHVSEVQYASYKRLLLISSTGKLSDPAPKEPMLKRFNLPLFSKTTPTSPPRAQAECGDPENIPPHLNPPSPLLQRSKSLAGISTNPLNTGSPRIGYTPSNRGSRAVSPTYLETTPSAEKGPHTPNRANTQSSPESSPESGVACQITPQLQPAFRDMAALLWHKNPSVQICVARLLADCAANCAETRSLIRDCGALTTSVALLRSSNQDVHRAAIETVANCVDGNETNRNMVVASALPHLASLLLSTSVETKLASLRAIFHCCRGHDIHQNVLRASKLVNALTQTLKEKGDKDVIALSLEVVIQLGTSGDNQEMFRNLGVVSTLYGLLTDSEARVHHVNIIRTMGVLCSNNGKIQEEFREKSGIEEVMNILKKAKDTDVPVIMDALVQIVGSNATNKAIVQNQSGFSVFIKSLHSPDQKHQRSGIQAFVCCLDSREACNSPLFNTKKTFSILEGYMDPCDASCIHSLELLRDTLIHNNTSQELIPQTHIIQKISSILDSDNLELIATTAVVMGRIALRNAPNQALLRQSGCVAKLAKKLESPQLTLEHQYRLLSSLANCCSDDSVTSKELCRAGVLTHASKALKSYRQDVQAEAALLIKNCIKDNEFASDYLRISSSISNLVPLLRARDPLVQCRTANCLWSSLQTEPLEICPAIRLAGGIETLVILVKAAFDIDTPKKTSEALSSSRIDVQYDGELSHMQLAVMFLRILDKCLLEDGASREAFCKVSGIHVLVEILKDERRAIWPVDVLKYAANAMGSACIQSEGNRSAVRSEKGLDVLLALHLLPQKEVVSSMVYALGRILEDSAPNKQEFGDFSGIEILLKLIDTYFTDNEIVVWIVSALHHAINDNEQNSIAVRTSQGFPLLIRLLKSTDGEVQWRTARLIGCLAKQGTNKEALRSDGAVVALSQLSKHANSYVRHFSEKALESFA